MQKGAGTFFTKDMNDSEDRGGEGDTEPDRESFGIGMSVDENWYGSVVGVIVECSSEADAVEGALDIVL